MQGWYGERFFPIGLVDSYLSYWTLGKKIEKKPAEEVVESPREEVVPPLNAPQPSELTTDKLLKQALANAPAPASSPPGKNKKKKPEPNVLSLMGECC